VTFVWRAFAHPINRRAHQEGAAAETDREDLSD